MGSFASTLASGEPKRGNYIPKPTDIYEVRRYLLRWFPAELANKIIDDAQYWPVVSCSAKPDWVISENHSPCCCLVTPRLDSLILEESFKIKLVRFVIASRDQGWASEDSFPTKYMGSWTWFEAGIIRYLKGDDDHEDEGVCNIQQVNELIKSQGSVSGPDVTMVKNPEKDSYTWHIQRNVRASREETVHEVVWTDSDPDDEVDEREFMDMTGAGRGKGFVRLLEPQHRIAVIAQAKFPGWTNHIASVEVQISYSI